MIKDYVVLDLETTGLNPKTDKIIEIGAARVREGKVVDIFSQYINPGRGLSEHVRELTGISDDDLALAQTIDKVIEDIVNFIGEDVLLGQNILFDFSFMKRAAVNNKLSFEKKGIDTLRIARCFLPELENRTLSTLCKYYGINLKAHRAVNDALATHELYLKLIDDFYNKEPSVFDPQAIVYKVKKESPITLKQIEQLKRVAQKCNIQILDEKILLPDGKVFFENQDITALTKNEASRLTDRLLSSYGR